MRGLLLHLIMNPKTDLWFLNMAQLKLANDINMGRGLGVFL